MVTQALQATTEQNLAVVPADVSSGALQSALAGDLSQMPAPERLKFYGALCNFTGLNPLSKPFDWLTFQGKLTLYANKGCAEQLRKINNASIDIIERKVEFGCFIVRVKITDKSGRYDEALAALPFNEKNPDGVALAMMKCETKAKRRATLSFYGLSMLVDREDVEDVQGERKTDIVAGTETVEDKVNRLNESLSKATTVEAEVVEKPEPKVEPTPRVETAKVVTPEPAKVVEAEPVKAPQAEPVVTDAEWNQEPQSDLLTSEEVSKLQAILTELPDPKKGVAYLMHRGWLPAGKTLEHTARREYKLIITKTPAFKRMVEGWSGETR